MVRMLSSGKEAR